MLPQVPGHAVQVLWREDGPDEQVRPQGRAGGHDEGDAGGGEDGQQRDVGPPYVGGPGLLLLPLRPLPVGEELAQEEEVRGRGPEDGAGPVADEGEETDGDDVVVADAVVGARQVDGGYGVGPARGEEGGVLEEDRGRGDLGDGEGEGLEVAEDEGGEEEQGDVCHPGLGYGQERREMVQ